MLPPPCLSNAMQCFYEEGGRDKVGCVAESEFHF